MKLVVRPLILEASVTEISFAAKSRTGTILVVSLWCYFKHRLRIVHCSA